MSSAQRILRAPLKGVVIPLEEIPDPVFAEGTMGPGFAIDPLSETLHAPCNGEIVQCARTGHAITLRDDAGAEWLLHIGLDTVELGGDGFEPLVAAGERVSAGDALCRFDADRLAQRATALISPMILTNAGTLALDPDSAVELLVAAGSVVELGEDLCRWEPTGIGTGDGISTRGPEASREAVLASASGLHARPAARLRMLAQARNVSMKLVTADGREADVASLSAMLNLGLAAGERITLVARGEQAQAAVDEALSQLAEIEPEASSESAASPEEPVAESLPGTLVGLVASPGLALGPLVDYDPPLPRIAERGESPERERRALEVALHAVDETLGQAHQAAVSRGQRSEADIFEAHRAWLADPDLRAAADRAIDAGRSAGQAWFESLESEAERLRGSHNTVLAGRADDLRDLQRQVMQHFSANETRDIDGIDGAILVARSLTPSQFVEIAERVAGLCLAAGGTTSHVSILARARGVPCLVAMGEPVLGAQSDLVCLDAARGVLELAPDDERVEGVRAQIERQHRRMAANRAAAREPVVTKDGRRLHVGANIGSSKEACEAAGAGADGVGLMRSEFLFLERPNAPTQDEQRREYLEAAKALNGNPVIVRLLDIGADKQLPYVALPAAPNPALGERGVRLWRTQSPLFDVQLDALLEACRDVPVDESGWPTLRLMVPMVSDATELRWVRERMETRAAALELERLPALGAMIEVPSAALCAASLAEVADFLSIGTNDLTQYALAMDREVASLASRSDVLHPGVLKLIASCIEGAVGRCLVGVCGAAAGDPLAGAVLAAMGVDELSVEPGRIATVKAALRELDLSELALHLPALLSLDDAAAVRAALAERLPTENTLETALGAASDSPTTITTRV